MPGDRSAEQRCRVAKDRQHGMPGGKLDQVLCARPK